MTLPLARQDPHLRRYRLRRLRLSAAGGTLSIVCPAGRADRRLEAAQQRAAASGDEPPYWAQVWPASVALARAVLREATAAGGWRGLHVVDLGCGVGVAGAAAARAGARITCLDLEADAVRFARFNAEQNAAPDGAVAVEARPFDWNRERLPEAVDHLLLADVTYRHRHHAPLLALLEPVLARGGCVWHMDPMRTASSDFVALLKERLDAVTEELLTANHDGDRIDVRLVRVRGPGSGPRADPP